MFYKSNAFDNNTLDIATMYIDLYPEHYMLVIFNVLHPEVFDSYL